MDGIDPTLEYYTIFLLQRRRPFGGEWALERAIRKKDFKALAELTIKDSNNVHATMLDTYPPIIYLNDVSREIMYSIHEMNAANGMIAAYTFDAGPNAHIITLKKHKKQIVEKLYSTKGVKDIIIAGQGSGPRMLQGKAPLIDENLLLPA